MGTIRCSACSSVRCLFAGGSFPLPSAGMARNSVKLTTMLNVFGLN